MEKYKVIIEEPAMQDFRDILKYITEVLIEPQIAKRLIKRIRKEVAELNRMPERHPLYDSEPWRSLGVRRLNIGNFAAFYIVVKDNLTVSVLSIIYGGRDIDNVLEKKLDK